jgi:hypothetical protein
MTSEASRILFPGQSAEPADSPDSAPIFVIGCQRSGTTLLRLLLNAHSKIAIPEEGTFWMPFLRKYGRTPRKKISGTELDRGLSYIEKNSQFRLWRIHPAEVCRHLKNKDDGCTLTELMSEFYNYYARSAKKSSWGDKTPGFFRMIPILDRLFPAARFVHLIRDGRDVYLSWKRRNPRKRNGAVAGAEWTHKVGKTRQALHRLEPGRSIEVRYEHLVANPQKTLRVMCHFLKLEYEPEMLDYWKTSARFIGARHSELIFKSITSSAVENWRDALSRNEVRHFEYVAGRMLVSLGYELSGWTPPEFIPPLSVILQLAYGLPVRAVEVIFTHLNLKVSSMLGLGTRAAGKGLPPNNTFSPH